MDNLHRLQELERELEQENEKTRSLRQEERYLQNQMAQLKKGPPAQIGSGHGQNIAALKAHLKNVIPSHLMPGNVGHKDHVQWLFHHVVDFDFGTNPTLLSPGTSLTRSFQVSQEAALLLMAVSWDAESVTTSGLLGPYNIQVRDRQSARQFNDRPVPVQMIGRNSLPTILPVPMLFMPNAFVDVIMSVHNTTSQATTGSGKHQFDFFGYRVRMQDADQVFSLLMAG